MLFCLRFVLFNVVVIVVVVVFSAVTMHFELQGDGTHYKEEEEEEEEGKKEEEGEEEEEEYSCDWRLEPLLVVQPQWVFDLHVDRRSHCYTPRYIVSHQV